jgi:polysaccharide export outer membrane protein
MKYTYLYTTLLLLLVALSACGPATKVVYMQDLQENVPLAVQEIQSFKLQPGDKITVSVFSRDEELAKMFNLTATTVNGQRGCAYTVSAEGLIDMPVLGPITAEGLSRLELANLIKYKLLAAKMLRDPVVTVEYANLSFYTLGELGHSGRIEIERDHITLLEAIAEAGDLTLTGRRDNVLVLRTENGIQTPYRVDLTRAQDIYRSPVYYIHQNDIIYVSPTQERANQSKLNANNVRTPSFWISMVSLLTSVVLFLTK